MHLLRTGMIKQIQGPAFIILAVDGIRSGNVIQHLLVFRRLNAQAHRNVLARLLVKSRWRHTENGKCVEVRGSARPAKRTELFQPCKKKRKSEFSSKVRESPVIKERLSGVVRGLASCPCALSSPLFAESSVKTKIRIFELGSESWSVLRACCSEPSRYHISPR